MGEGGVEIGEDTRETLTSTLREHDNNIDLERDPDEASR